MAVRYFDGLTSFKTFCEEQAILVPKSTMVAATMAAGILLRNIRNTYGSYELAPLQDSTIELRKRRGGVLNDRPLLEDGRRLRDSFTTMVEPMGEGSVAGVGSSEKLVVSHEHGYTTAEGSMIPGKIVPPRPAFSIGVYRSMPELMEMVTAVLGPGARFRNLAGKFTSPLDATSGSVLAALSDSGA